MPPSYRPSGGYYRRALRTAAASLDLAALLSLGLALVRECEYLRTWARQNGMTPPHFEILPEEAEAKRLDVIDLTDAFRHSQIHADGHALHEAEARRQR